MLMSEKGLLGKKSAYFISCEDHLAYRILNINITVSENIAGTDIIKNIGDLLKSKDLVVLMGLAFTGTRYEHAALVNELKKLKGIDIPLSIMLYGKSEVLNIQLICSESKNVTCVEGSSSLKMLQANSSSIIYLNSLQCEHEGLSKQEETSCIFNSVSHYLSRYKLAPANIARTWIYLDNILEWYDDFNMVRTSFFKEHRIFDGLIPASTGIGVANSSAKSIILSAIAIDADNGLKLEEIDSPLQCSATDYKSSFSRAIKISGSTYKKLMISGTASIMPDGKTAFKGMPGEQLNRTFQVMLAILKKEGMDFRDVSRAIAYFPDRFTLGIFNDYCDKYNLNSDCVLKVEADICRDDLMFEMELDAFSGI